jgi:hypothetical protein
LTVTFIEQACLPYLRRAQNDDGGWGFNPGAGSRVESTAWAILALQEFEAVGGAAVERAVKNAANFLKSSQLADGSWPAAFGQREGSWVTSLACWALVSSGQLQANVDRGVQWLLKEWPGDAKPWARMLRAVTGGRKLTEQDDSLSGWSWTPGTASWVEPTSYAMIVLRNCGQSADSKLQKRIHTAKSMLHDRMCPGGGWNCGNPMVYGVAGEPQVGPTVWALMALRDDARQPRIQATLNWLERNADKVASPASLALTSIGLQLMGRSGAADKLAPRIFDEKNEIVWNVQVAAWTALAASAWHRWLAVTVPGSAIR